MPMLRKLAVLAALMIAAFSAPVRAQPQQLPPPYIGYYPASSSSLLGGIQAGYNWQRGPILFGVEGDLNGLDLSSMTSGTTVGLPDTATAKIDWYGTLRGKLGFTNGPWLFYGTGGLAVGHVKLNNTYNIAGLEPDGPSVLIGNTSVVKAGWVVGAGVDYLVNKNLIVGLQYQYVDLGHVNLAGIYDPEYDFTGPSSRVHAQFQVVTLSASWKFAAPPSASNAMASMYTKAVKAPPPPADPWSGLYAGTKIGGATGNRLTVVPGDLPAAF